MNCSSRELNPTMVPTEELCALEQPAQMAAPGCGDVIAQARKMRLHKLALLNSWSAGERC